MARSVEYIYYLKDFFSRNAHAMALAAQRVKRNAHAAGLSLKTMALAGGALMTYGGVRMLTGMVDKYADFQEVLYGVRKVVPGVIKDWGAIEESIRKTGREIPMAREQIAMFYEAGVRAGVADPAKGTKEYIRDLKAFASLASSASFAFNMNAARSATVLAKMKSALGMSLPEMKSYLQQINLLGDTMATNESNVVEIVRRVGANVQALGGDDKKLQRVLREHVAAAGAAMSAAGVRDDVAGTGLRNFMLRAGLGKEGVKEMRKGMKAAGLDASKIAKMMKTDFLGSLEVVLKATSQIKDLERRNAAIKGIFGMRGVDAMGPLLGNLKLLQQAMALSEDVGRREARWNNALKVKFATIRAHQQLAANSVANLRDSMVAGWSDELVWMYDKIRQISEYLQENPGTAKFLGGLMAALLVIGPLLIGLGLIAMSLSALGITAGVVGGAFAALFGLPGLIAAGFVFAGVLVYRHWSGIKDWFGTLGDKIGNIFKGLGQVILGSLTLDEETIKSGIMKVFEGIPALVDHLASGIVQTMKTAFSQLNDIMRWFLPDESGSKWDSFLSGLGGKIKQLGLDFKAIFSFEMPGWLKSISGWLKGEQKAAAVSPGAANPAVAGGQANVQAQAGNPAVAGSRAIVQAGATKVEVAGSVRTETKIYNELSVLAPPVVKLQGPGLSGSIPLDAKFKRGLSSATATGSAPLQGKSGGGE